MPAKLDKPMNMSVPGDGDPKKFQPKRATQEIETSPTLSMIDNPNFPNDTIKTRKIAFLVADGFDDAAVSGYEAGVDDRRRRGHDSCAAAGSVDGSQWRQ